MTLQGQGRIQGGGNKGALLHPSLLIFCSPLKTEKHPKICLFSFECHIFNKFLDYILITTLRKGKSTRRFLDLNALVLFIPAIKFS